MDGTCKIWKLIGDAVKLPTVGDGGKKIRRVTWKQKN